MKLKTVSKGGRLLDEGEETVEEAVDALCDLVEVLGILAKLAVIAIDNHELALIGFNPFLIAFLKAL